MRQLLGLGTGPPEAAGQSGSGLRRGEDALEASRGRERAHEPCPRGPRRLRLDPPAPPPRAAPGIRRSIANESPSRARKIRPTPMPDRGLDRLQPEAVRDRLPRRDAVRAQRQSDRRLQQADVAGPEREERRHVHQQQHERRPRAAARGCRRPSSPCRPRRTGRANRGIWKSAATAAAPGACSTPRPCRPISTSRGSGRAPPSPSGRRCRALANANANSAKPIATTTTRLVIAQWGIRAVAARTGSAPPPARGRRACGRRPCRRAPPTSPLRDGPGVAASGSAPPPARALRSAPGAPRWRTDPPKTPRTPT